MAEQLQGDRSAFIRFTYLTVPLPRVRASARVCVLLEEQRLCEHLFYDCLLGELTNKGTNK